MIEKATIIYMIVDDILKAMRHKEEDVRHKMNDAQVITTALIAAIVFCGSIEKAKVALYETGHRFRKPATVASPMDMTLRTFGC